MTRLSLVLTLALFSPLGAAAQRIDPVAVQAEAVRAQGVKRAWVPPTSHDVGLRTLIGVGSAFAGAYVGALSGIAMPRSPCNCEDPGLDQMVVGGMVGSVLVPALLASAPTLASTCGYGKRFAVGLLGAVAGATLGGVAGGQVDGAGVVFGYIGGAGAGAGIASALCH